MGNNFFTDAGEVINMLFLIYSISIVVVYTSMSAISIYYFFYYRRRNIEINYDTLLSAGDAAPSVSVIASAYNESATIISCVRALLNLRYFNYDVIVVNDGSTDDTLEKLQKEFQLQKHSYIVNYKIKTKTVRGVYRSENPIFRKLIVVDKENGGKADAMNCGINISYKFYVVCVDVDSILDRDALLKLVKVITEKEDGKVVGVGASVHVANGCKFENGVIKEHVVPKKYFTCMQVVEYLRAFLIGRISLGQTRSLLLISGALGIFRKEAILKVGGYLTSTIGEDMELVTRIQEYHYKKKIPHLMSYIPDPLLWTEVPESVRLLGRQRTRWTRGLIDTLKLHKKLFLNPKYRSVGLLGYPYFFFFEWMAAIVELTGYVYFFIALILGTTVWSTFFFLFVFMYLFGTTFSFLGIFMNEIGFHVYHKTKDVMRLICYSMLEAFIYHPCIVFWSVKGNYMYLRRIKSWGVMTRKGFGQEKA
ncbi:MAG: glycosyltransferase family 2 protein [Prevotella sp.]|jgi:cellulose synthase/poly-beta-1,6-N-acetylglucosamine synthase-like glycosyltransferase|nr:MULTISPECIES: glycosyltransferase [unclassified Prevotella]MCH3970824.1 glycosyltransferase family 2 protein [Prevotella sp.]MCH3985707.1 glycosyltransferase family 2 protein [Prevotella sp.]MCH3993260.1 glycosyltransferase family 2 protein [Prevotella sp.]MCH4017899.1 glycosyltransferase family 2 protein [Prevotella sp.]MCH4100905.1 glycosyltransferase family 2 protein [Prevotella sp.]